MFVQGCIWVLKRLSLLVCLHFILTLYSLFFLPANDKQLGSRILLCDIVIHCPSYIV